MEQAKLTGCEPATDNNYEQKKIQLSEKIVTALANSPELLEALKKLDEAESHLKRIGDDFQSFQTQKEDLEKSIAELRENFSSEDSNADLQKLENYTIKLNVITESIPLLQKKIAPDSPLHREKRDCTDLVKSKIFTTLRPIQLDLQKEIDAKFRDIIEINKAYESALSQASLEQKTIPKIKAISLLRRKDILPDFDGVVDLLLENKQAITSTAISLILTMFLPMAGYRWDPSMRKNSEPLGYIPPDPFSVHGPEGEKVGNSIDSLRGLPGNRSMAPTREIR